MFARLSFTHALGGVLAVCFVAGFALFVITGATTNKGTPGAIRTENASIVRAERMSCTKFGKYASISILRREGLLTRQPVYNSVVYIPGAHCGTIIVGSPAYQSPAH